MPYNPLIPQANDLISVSQGQLLGNFTAVPVWEAVNHYEFGTGVNEGKHRFVTLPNQVAAPVPPFLANEDALYTFNYTPPAGVPVAELWVHKQVPAATAEIPLTASILSQVAAPLINSNGWTYLPSGIIMKWGFAPQLPNPPPVNSSIKVLLNAIGVASPAFTQIFNAQVTMAVTTAATSSNLRSPIVKLSMVPNPFELQIGNNPDNGVGLQGYFWCVIGR